MKGKRKPRIEIEHVPLPPPNTVTVQDTLYTGGSNKRPRIEITNTFARRPATEIPALTEPTMIEEALPSPSKRHLSTHKRTADLLRDLETHTAEFLEALFCQEHDTTIDQPCAICGIASAAYKCNDCYLSAVLCGPCLVACHSQNPLHRIVERVASAHLDGYFFRSTELASLGLIFHLGHHGASCPNSLASSIKHVVIVDSNGLHRAQLAYCQCEAAGTHIHQLVISGLFPATTERIQTLFTQRVLREFCQHTHESGTTAYAYFAALRRLTNDTFKDQVDDRYREFLRATRMWRHLADLTRSGQAFDINRFLPEFHRDSVAVLCPACPQLGINMCQDWERDYPTKRHVHQLSVAIDGNFRSTLKKKPHDPAEVALTDGQAYFVREQPYRGYLKNVEDDAELATCTGFKAGDIMRQSRNKGLIVTGVIAVSCARHSIVRPRGVVDMYHGERYSNVDYAVAQTLQAYQGSRLPIELNYDIVCKYHINLRQRMKARFPTLVGLLDRMSYFIPSMHVEAHQEPCQKQFKRDFAPHTGKCDGEGSERVWSELNQWGPSTSEMTPAHRHDVMNDNIGDWNTRKLLGMNIYLVDRLMLATDERAKFHREFQELTAGTPAELIAEWKQLPTAPQISADGRTVNSVYMPDEKKVPTQAEMQLAILAEQDQSMGSDSIPTGPANLMHTLVFGFEIEQLMVNTQRHAHLYAAIPTASAELTLRRMRTRLRTKLRTWAELQPKVMPMVAIHYSDDLPDPETVRLNFPSDFDNREHPKLNLVAARVVERRLREGQAHDALKALKQAIVLKLANLNARRQHVAGQRGSTRAAEVINSQVDIIAKHANNYRRIRTALVELGMPENHPEFQVLNPEDCTAKRMFTDQNEKNVTKGQETVGMREAAKELSWIWRVGHRVQTAKESSDWDVESQRVHWFLSRAQKDRWIEEVEIVEEEMRRVVRFFAFYEATWIAMAREADGTPGKRAYAMRVADKYRELGRDAHNRFPASVLTHDGGEVIVPVTN